MYLRYPAPAAAEISIKWGTKTKREQNAPAVSIKYKKTKYCSYLSFVIFTDSKPFTFIKYIPGFRSDPIFTGEEL